MDIRVLKGIRIGISVVVAALGVASTVIQQKEFEYNNNKKIEDFLKNINM